MASTSENAQVVRALRAVRDALVTEIGPEVGLAANGPLDDTIVTLDWLIAQVTPRAARPVEESADWGQLQRDLAALTGDRGATRDSSEGVGDFYAPAHPALIQIANRVRELTADADFGDALRDPTSAESAWFRRAVTLTEAQLSVWDRMVSDVAASVHASDEFLGLEELRSRLNEYLVRALPGVPEDPIVTLHRVAGGRTKLTALGETRPRSHLPRHIVLRLDSDLGHTGSCVAGEFTFLSGLHDQGLAVPKPILAETDSTLLGGAFILMEQVSGTATALAAIDRGAVDDVPGLVREMAVTLAQLHSARPVPTDGRDLPNDRSSDPNEMVRQYYRRWLSHQRPPESLAVELGFAWLLGHPLPTDRPRAIVHGDFGPHNVLVDRSHLAALLDWELAHLGDPAEDLGYCRLVINQIADFDDFAATYLAAGGIPEAVDPEALDFFGVWHGLMSGVHIAHKFDQLATGQRRDIGGVSSAVHYYQKVCLHGVKELNGIVGSSRTGR
jgi:aminoglycoside phosphotransferase (APT) family kinase protein